jgi:hypothetical protein
MPRFGLAFPVCTTRIGRPVGPLLTVVRSGPAFVTTRVSTPYSLR